MSKTVAQALSRKRTIAITDTTAIIGIIVITTTAIIVTTGIITGVNGRSRACNAIDVMERPVAVRICPAATGSFFEADPHLG